MRTPTAPPFGEEDSVGYGAGRAEVGQELETEADHKVPDVSGHLGAGDEDPPDEDNQHGVEGVADVPQSWRQGENTVSVDAI